MVDLKYTNNKSEKLKTQKRNIIWFNPLFSKSFSINIVKTFLQLITKHFPRSHRNHKFQANTVKVSCSCMSSVLKIIKGHQKVTSKPRDHKPKCNCIKKAECPMERNCQVNYIVCKCDVTRQLPKRKCLGLLQGEWKSRLYNQKLSFKHK